ncbi:MAG: hypothetical protein COX30_02270 [Candidatus Moranbacteria bacterium CG23_combo_of_CG06-09_8_20_14_all_39_10]|nr:MAG: hypothetical protein COX30_02270 [Candidatus Moranbacteria bacterium CG23_combo_of_CG06-09_8_20_14_all_39_10]
MKDMNKNKNKLTGLNQKIRSFFQQEYFQSHIVFWLLILSLVANIIDWLILKIWIKPVDFSIILHYNVYFGVDQIGSYRQVYLLPMIGLILFIINLVLSMFFYGQKKRIASYILLMATLMIQFSLIVASMSQILINY